MHPCLVIFLRVSPIPENLVKSVTLARWERNGKKDSDTLTDLGSGEHKKHAKEGKVSSRVQVIVTKVEPVHISSNNSQPQPGALCYQKTCKKN